MNRVKLHSIASKSYEKIEKSDAQDQNITALLSKSTFTVMTAHQPTQIGVFLLSYST